MDKVYILCLCRKTQNAAGSFLYCLIAVKWEVNSWLTCSCPLRTEAAIIHKYIFHKCFYIWSCTIEIELAVFCPATAVLEVNSEAHHNTQKPLYSQPKCIYNPICTHLSLCQHCHVRFSNEDSLVFILLTYLK